MKIHSPTLCIILARGGSKGLVNKNALPLLGKPMVGWTIEHALGSDRVDDVILTTDGDAIARAGLHYGIEVINRPSDLASDAATVDAAARHAVSKYEMQHDTRCEKIVILYGNIPVRPADLTDRALEKLNHAGCDSVQSVSPAGKFHPFWMKKIGGASGDELLMYEPNNVYRRQDLPPTYMLDGGVIAVTRDSLFTIVDGEPHAFLGDDRRAVVTGHGEVVDVDNDLDLALAETILSKRFPSISKRSQLSRSG